MSKSHVPSRAIEGIILVCRGHRVILDADLAKLYGVSTKALNQAVKRNRRRFPSDFLMQLAEDEWAEMRNNRSQIVTGTQKHRDPHALPFAFTEHGCIMAANVLRSGRAVKMSVFVVRAFIRMRAMLKDNKELARRLFQLEKELKKRLDVHETAIVGILQRIMDLIDPPPGPEPTRKQIGF